MVHSSVVKYLPGWCETVGATLIPAEPTKKTKSTGKTADKEDESYTRYNSILFTFVFVSMGTCVPPHTFADKRTALLACNLLLLWPSFRG